MNLEEMNERFWKATEENDIVAFENLVEFDEGLLRQKSAVCLNTALHVASSKGHTDLVRLILRLCPNLVAEKNARGETPFHAACRHARTHVVMLLLETEPRVASELNLVNDSPFSLACKNRHLDIVKLLLSQSWLMDVEEDRANLTGLRELISGDKTSIVRGMLEARPNIDRRSPNGLQRKVEKFSKFITNLVNKSSSNSLQGITALRDGFQQKPEKLSKFATNLGKKGDIWSARSELGQHRCASESHRKELTELHRSRQSRQYETQREALQNARNTIILVAILIATVTFSVGLNPPGGVYQEGRLKGQSIAGRKVAFKIFVISNSIALITSMCIVIFLVSIIPFRRKKLMQLMMIAHKVIWVAAGFMTTAFVSATWVIMPHAQNTKWMFETILAVGVGSLVTISIYLGVKLVRHWLRKQKWKDEGGHKKKKHAGCASTNNHLGAQTGHKKKKHIDRINNDLEAQSSKSMNDNEFRFWSQSESSNSDVDSATSLGYSSHPL